MPRPYVAAGTKIRILANQYAPDFNPKPFLAPSLESDAAMQGETGVVFIAAVQLFVGVSRGPDATTDERAVAFASKHETVMQMPTVALAGR